MLQIQPIVYWGRRTVSWASFPPFIADVWLPLRKFTRGRFFRMGLVRTCLSMKSNTLTNVYRSYFLPHPKPRDVDNVCTICPWISRTWQLESSQRPRWCSITDTVSVLSLQNRASVMQAYDRRVRLTSMVHNLSPANRQLLGYRLDDGRRKALCDVCGKGFLCNAEVQRHRRTHFGIRPFECSMCKRSFALKSNGVVHVRDVHKIVENPAQHIVRVMSDWGNSPRVTTWIQ